MTLRQLQEMLEQQFGPFIRDSNYRQAFDRAMHSMQGLTVNQSQIDVFYLFMHHLIMELFDEIDRLKKQLQFQQDTGN